MRNIGLAVLLLAAACAPVVATPASAIAAPSAAASPSATAVVDRVSGWRADISALIPGMAKLHPNITHSATRAQLDDAAASLAARVPTLSDDEVLVGLMRIVAMVTAAGCDGHTGLYVWGEGTYPVESLPLRLWSFTEGVYVIDALPPFASLIGTRIDAIGGHPMSEVLAGIAPLVPRDNDTTVQLLLPRYLVIPQVLRGLGLSGAGAPVLTVAGRDVTVTPIPMDAYNAWAGRYGLFLPADRGVLYLSRMDDVLWWSELDGGSLLYVQYNRADYLSQSTFADLRTALAGRDKVIVDLRLNYGGEIPSVAPLLAALQDPAVSRPGHLFVITGRNTFSAASMLLAQLQATTSAIIVGEPMGGCPNPNGNARPLTLPYGGLVVEVGTKQEATISADDHRLQIPPTLPARLTPAAWLAKQDPALDAIRSYRP